MRHEPDGLVEVPERVTVYRTILYDDEKCLGCGTCARGCPAEAIEARPPKAVRAHRPPPQGKRRMTADGAAATRAHWCSSASAPARSRTSISTRLETHAGLHAEVVRGDHWCSRGGQAQLLELMEAGERLPRQLVFAGCSADFAARRFQKLCRARPPARDRRHPRGLQLGAQRRRRRRDRQGGAHHRLFHRLPGRAGRHHELRRAPRYRRRDRRRRGRHAGRRRARPDGPPRRARGAAAFLGGRAARIGTVFPTNDCGQCLPTTDAQAGTRKCFHRNVAIDHPDLVIQRRSTVEAGHRPPRRLPGEYPHAAQHRHRRLHQLRHVRDRLPSGASEPGKKAIFTEFYDGRVIRTVDLETCTFCGSAPSSALSTPSISASRRDAPR